jgi:predicted heme/steroid binding protein/uncharacterized membrane protein
MKEFTPEELARYNGQDGKPAYVAMGGRVYDVSESKLWKNGQHMRRHDAGADLSDIFPKAPHGPEVFERVAQAGVLRSATQSAPKEVPALVQTLLDFHPHPIMVHFPQAFLSFAPLFLILYYATRAACLERTAFYMMLCGAAMAVPTVATGFFHWIFKYGRAAGGVYKFKIIMSMVVLVLSWVAVLAHTSAGPLKPAPANIPVLVLYLVIVPMIVALGHAGGMIEFGHKKKT